MALWIVVYSTVVEVLVVEEEEVVVVVEEGPWLLLWCTHISFVGLNAFYSTQFTNISTVGFLCFWPITLIETSGPTDNEESRRRRRRMGMRRMLLLLLSVDAWKMSVAIRLVCL